MTDEQTDAKALAETDLKAACDLVIERAAVMMVEELGASIPQMLDRMLTYAGAQASTIEGSPAAAKIFHRLADNIANGCFHTITGEGAPRGPLN